MARRIEVRPGEIRALQIVTWHDRGVEVCFRERRSRQGRAGRVSVLDIRRG